MCMWSCFLHVNSIMQLTVTGYKCIILGSGEDCCLHEVRQIHEDSCQQQDGQVGTQERVKDMP